MEFYIREISDSNGVVAYKYGISKDTEGSRLPIFKSANKKTGYSFKTIKLIENTAKPIRRLEKTIKSIYKEGYLTKKQLPDGYTETIKPEELPFVLSIVDRMRTEVYIKKYVVEVDIYGTQYSLRYDNNHELYELSINDGRDYYHYSEWTLEKVKMEFNMYKKYISKTWEEYYEEFFTSFEYNDKLWYRTLEIPDPSILYPQAFDSIDHLIPKEPGKLAYIELNTGEIFSSSDFYEYNKLIKKLFIDKSDLNIDLGIQKKAVNKSGVSQREAKKLAIRTAQETIVDKYNPLTGRFDDAVTYTNEEKNMKRIIQSILALGDRAFVNDVLMAELLKAKNPMKFLNDIKFDIHNKQQGNLITAEIKRLWEQVANGRNFILNTEKAVIAESVLRWILSERYESILQMAGGVYGNFIDENGQLKTQKSADAFLRLFVSYESYKNNSVKGARGVKFSRTGLV